MRLDLTLEHPRLDLGSSLTADQLSAMRIDCEVAVTAGAGAGKTHTLALRYVSLLLELAVQAVEADPRNPRPTIDAVLLLTFTEKAAQEMADRCYRRLLSLAELVRRSETALERFGPGYGASLAAAVDYLLDSFDRAAISTFHAFCGQVLREFPSETRTDPAFEILEAIEADPMRRRACEAALAQLGNIDPAALSVVLEALGNRRQALSALTEIVAQRGTLRERLEAHASGQVTIEEIIAKALPTLDFVRKWLDPGGFDLVDAIVNLIGNRSRSKPYLAIRALRERGRPTEPLEVLAYQRDLMDALTHRYTGGAGALTVRDLSHHSFMGKDRDWPSSDARIEARDRLASLISSRLHANLPRIARQCATLPYRADAELLPIMQRVATLALDAIERFETALDARQGVDFDEILLRAVAAVEREPALRTALQARYRYLMVDEFQDTDDLQWSMVQAIGRPEGMPHDRIFLVGDAKQAIYRFRGGDVTVFSGATRTVTESVVLRENFRSREALITWFNAVFQTAFGPPDRDGLQAWEAPYHQLVAGRGSPGGSVVLYAHELDDTDGITAEAEGIARLIAGQILPGRGRYEGSALLDRDQHPSPPVAILLRSRTHLRQFERALKKHRVPFVVAKGTGFWSRPEVLDLVNTIHALATDDPLSVVGALRSPLFAVTDQEIHDLLAGAPDARDALGAWLNGRESRSERLDAARGTYRRLCQLRDRIPVSMLLREVASSTNGWHLWALADDWGTAEQNVLRLVDMAARFDSRGAEGLQEVAEWFLSQVETQTRESEAAVVPDRARVILMTVHASKGLEFPVVIVPDLHRRPYLGNDRTRMGRIRSGSMELACPVPDPTAQVRDTVRPGLLEAIRVQAADEEIAEHARLFYVAVTRARDHLVLTGKHEEPSSQPVTWMELIMRHHSPDLTERDGLLVEPLEGLLGMEAEPLQPALSLPDIPDDAARTLSPIPPVLEVEISPSSLDAFEMAPVEWYKTHILGIPSMVARRKERQRIVATARGEVIHALLEDDLAGDLEVARKRWAARAHAEGLGPAEVAETFDQLARHLKTAASDPHLARALASTGYSEVNFRLHHGHVILRGQIDRLWLDAEADEWVVLDYKSENLDRTGSMLASATHLRQLLAYGWAASRVLRAHGDARPIRGELYYTSTGELCPLGTWSEEEFARFEEVLDRAGEYARLDWETVKRL